MIGISPEAQPNADDAPAHILVANPDDALDTDRAIQPPEDIDITADDIEQGISSTLSPMLDEVLKPQDTATDATTENDTESVPPQAPAETDTESANPRPGNEAAAENRARRVPAPETQEEDENPRSTLRDLLDVPESDEDDSPEEAPTTGETTPNDEDSAAEDTTPAEDVTPPEDTATEQTDDDDTPSPQEPSRSSSESTSPPTDPNTNQADPPGQREVQPRTETPGETERGEQRTDSEETRDSATEDNDDVGESEQTRDTDVAPETPDVTDDAETSRESAEDATDSEDEATDQTPTPDASDNEAEAITPPNEITEEDVVEFLTEYLNAQPEAAEEQAADESAQPENTAPESPTTDETEGEAPADSSSRVAELLDDAPREEPSTITTIRPDGSSTTTVESPERKQSLPIPGFTTDEELVEGREADVARQIAEQSGGAADALPGTAREVLDTLQRSAPMTDAPIQDVETALEDVSRTELVYEEADAEFRARQAGRLAEWTGTEDSFKELEETSLGTIYDEEQFSEHLDTYKQLHTDRLAELQAAGGDYFDATQYVQTDEGAEFTPLSTLSDGEFDSVVEEATEAKRIGSLRDERSSALEGIATHIELEEFLKEQLGDDFDFGTMDDEAYEELKTRLENVNRLADIEARRTAALDALIEDDPEFQAIVQRLTDGLVLEELTDEVFQQLEASAADAIERLEAERAEEAAEQARRDAQAEQARAELERMEAEASAGQEEERPNIIGNPRSDGANVECDPRTEDLGVTTAYHRGNPIEIRLCSVLNIPSEGQADNPGGTFSTQEANGHAIVNSRVSTAWYELAEAAEQDGINLRAMSSFRSHAHQQSLWDNNPNPSFVARPGYSSHQAGDAVDFLNMGVKGGATCATRATANSPQYRWLFENAEKFGFYQFAREAWHWDSLPKENRCDSSNKSPLEQSALPFLFIFMTKPMRRKFLAGQLPTINAVMSNELPLQPNSNKELYA